jgi:hypothetical protein
MINRCADCGADIALVGIRHRCNPTGHRAAEGGAGQSARAQPAPLPRLEGVPPSEASSTPKGSRPLQRAHVAAPGRLPRSRRGAPRSSLGVSP